MILDREAQGHAAMLAFSALVSFSFSFGHLIAAEISAGVLTAVRFAIALVVMVGLAVVLRQPLAPLFHRAWRWMILGGLMAIYFITMFEALQITSPVATAAVFTLTPFIAASLGWLILRQPTSPGTLSILGLGGVGSLWVIFRADIDRVLAFDIGPGEAIFMVGAVCHAAVPAVSRRLSDGATTFQVATGSVAGALVVTSIYSLPDLLKTDFSALRPLVWVVALYLGVITTALTFFLLQFAVPRLGPGKLMAYTYLVPCWVVLQGLPLGQTEPIIVYGGVVLTLCAMVLLLRTEAS
jgi:drug/metabolite transporter (DMT)-like permease